MVVTAFAAAKVNLYLHVTGRRPDGYHLLDSLIAFADIGDRVTAEPAAMLSLTVGGPEAASLAGISEDNLVLRAARLLVDRTGTDRGGALFLEKNLPVAAGIGGGSSDAAAALRALIALWHLSIGEGALRDLGARLGADLPACLYGRAVWVGGIGEHVEPAPDLPEAGILLANPRRKLATAAVFATRSGPFGQAGRFAPMPEDAVGLARALGSRRNDLTDAAIGLVPEIGAVLVRLARLPGALVARMSGSGATCFALFGDRGAAEEARVALAAAEPQWWCAAGDLVRGEVVAGQAPRIPG
ncbi:MAG TPA: 4-(cytidine 5'-diphospho)-2-C-methyl-D-erythritol kinase [Stellaceae bacterium]|nr:4-(cytidine 5'-diphospho)-2-C-methyl-D-erythritol kinase [Stellaceae bacterium]